MVRSAFVEKATAKDELRSWQTMPYVEAIMSQSFSQFTFQVKLQLSPSEVKCIVILLAIVRVHFHLVLTLFHSILRCGL